MRSDQFLENDLAAHLKLPAYVGLAVSVWAICRLNHTKICTADIGRWCGKDGMVEYVERLRTEFDSLLTPEWEGSNQRRIHVDVSLRLQDISS